jgi:hypothetical protein
MGRDAKGQGGEKNRGTPRDTGRGRKGTRMGALRIVSVFLALLLPVCWGLWPLLEGIPLARGGARGR